MERAQAPVPASGGWLARTREYLLDVRKEMGKVTWPTRDELIKATRMIVIFSVLLGVLIGWLDLLLQLLLVDGVARLVR